MALDRVVDGAHDVGVVPPGRDLEALLGGVVAERGDDLLAGGAEAGLGQVVAEQVDRGHQRLRLQRQQARRAREVVAVGVGVDLDLVADDLGVEDVGAAAEVDDVEHVDVLAQLLVRDVELVQHLLDGQPPPSRAAPIRRPASVTRRAKRSGRITDSPRPFERRARRSTRRSAGRPTSATSNSARWRWRSSSAATRPRLARSPGSSSRAFSRQPSTHEMSWRAEA